MESTNGTGQDGIKALVGFEVPCCMATVVQCLDEKLSFDDLSAAILIRSAGLENLQRSL